MFQKDVIMQLFNDHQVKKLRQIALLACGIKNLDQVFEEVGWVNTKELSAPVELLTLMGLANGSVEDLLLASHLQKKYNVDISILMEPLCEKYKPLKLNKYLEQRRQALLSKQGDFKMSIEEISDDDMYEEVEEEFEEEEKDREIKIVDKAQV